MPWYKSYLFGFLTELVIFQIIAIALTFLKSSLVLLTMLWLVCCVFLFLFGIWRAVPFWKKFISEPSRKNKRKKMVSTNKWENYIITVAVITLVVFQVVFVTFHVHEDLDDAWYVGTAVISYHTDTMNRISPYTGEILNSFSPDYVLSPWPVFCAMLGKISFIHPTIIMHTFIPILFIPLCYMVYFLLGNEIFKHNKNKTLWLLLFLCFFNIYGNWSIRSTSSFLLFRIWQGKAILSNIIIPIIIYLFIKLVNNINDKKIYSIILFITVMAGTMVSSMGVFLCPVMLVALSVVDALLFKRLRNGIVSIICIIPCILQFIIYLWMRY